MDVQILETMGLGAGGITFVLVLYWLYRNKGKCKKSSCMLKKDGNIAVSFEVGSAVEIASAIEEIVQKHEDIGKEVASRLKRNESFRKRFQMDSRDEDIEMAVVRNTGAIGEAIQSIQKVRDAEEA